MKKRELLILKKNRFEMVYQMEQMDCGVTCLQMILKYYGSEFPIYKLREITNTDRNGVSALGLQKGLEYLGFESVVLRAESSLWSDQNLIFPLIANVINDNQSPHFVVVYDKKGDVLRIADPRRGKYQVNLQEFSEWTGVVILAEVNQSYKVHVEKVRGLTSFVPVVLKNKKIVFKIILCSFIITFLSIIGTYYFQLVIDSLIPNNNVGLLNIFSIALIVSLILQHAFEFVKSNLLVSFGQKMNFEIVYNYFSHILHLPMKFFSTRKVGDLTSRFLDANRIIEALANATLSIFIDLTMFIVVGLFLAFQNGHLFLITLLSLPIYSMIIILYTKKIEKANEQEMEQSSSLTSYIVESLNGIETIKSFQLETSVLEDFKHGLNNLNSQIQKTSLLNHSQMFLKTLIDALMTTIVIWIGAYFIMDSHMTLGELITYNSILFFFTTPLQQIVNLQAILQAAEVASKRLNEILYIEQEIPNDINSNVAKFNFSLEISKVNHSYNLKDLTLKDIDFTINRQSKMAIIGVSGSGKSTLAKLLVKFHQPFSGEILLDGVSYKNISNDSLREMVKYIPQDVFLFNGSLYKNIVFGKQDSISIDQLREYCKIAKILDFVDSLPLGFETIVEEGGGNFSTGQKQRIAIVRALVSEAKILIFDETLSGLDPISVNSIMDNLLSIEDKTMIFITHSFQIAKKCQRLLIMENGKIVADGSHINLKEDATYKKLWENYLV